MYYLLTGHKPADAVSRLQGKSTDLVPPKKYKVKVSKQWMNLIHWCMALERKERIGSAAELASQIRELIGR